MMNEMQRNKTIHRLNRIEGQIRGLQKMVLDNRYCMDILAQTRSVVAALRGVEDVIMENHLSTCVSEAIRSNDPVSQRQKIDEVMEILSQFKKHG